MLFRVQQKKKGNQSNRKNTRLDLTLYRPHAISRCITLFGLTRYPIDAGLVHLICTMLFSALASATRGNVRHIDAISVRVYLVMSLGAFAEGETPPPPPPPRRSGPHPAWCLAGKAGRRRQHVTYHQPIIYLSYYSWKCAQVYTCAMTSAPPPPATAGSFLLQALSKRYYCSRSIKTRLESYSS